MWRAAFEYIHTCMYLDEESPVHHVANCCVTGLGKAARSSCLFATDALVKDT